jgi:2-C-methyl-D-erythritol 2,4-cyclodiphosphate synthase
VTAAIRVGWGFDAHRFGGTEPLVLGGVTLPAATGVIATSDGDVAAHALADALLGAAALGDLGSHFPSSDPRWEGASSLQILEQVAALCAAEGLVIGNVDVTVVAEEVRIAPHREAMRTALAAALGIGVERVSVKATTTDGLGFVGSGEGIAAHAVATLQRSA